MNKYKILFGLISCVFAVLLLSSFIPEWGFFGHRKINRLAVYCLPGEMINLFKSNIDFISEHAVDPDKRRYATKHEAVRHYIDIDHWGVYPYENVPRDYVSAVTKFGEFYSVNGKDTLRLNFTDIEESESFQQRRLFVANNWYPNRYEETIFYDCDSIFKYFSNELLDCESFRFIDVFSDYGIVPYELLAQQKRLTKAFQARDEARIIRIATDFGHYISDAHVPLHTTENYNGQLTNQEGIHAFWESRIPELYAEESFDFLVGGAEYIEDKRSFFWDIVLESNSYVEDVLRIEKELSESFPSDKQYCYEERLSQTVRIECEAYAAEYNRRMGGMVEDRMRKSVKAVADCWYTAWVDAGQPIFEKKGILAKIDEELEKAFQLGRIFGRVH